METKKMKKNRHIKVVVLEKELVKRINMRGRPCCE